MAYPPRGRADFFDPGSWNAVCYECGRTRKASDLKKHWQGYFVCPEHWEERHPQDFVRGVPDIQSVPWSQPEPADQFVSFPNGIATEADPFANNYNFISTESGSILFTET